MTNEEKAREIASVINYEPDKQIQFVNDKVYRACMIMAQWKDAQYAEVLVRIAEANEQSKMAIKQIRQNLEKMYKINNQ